MNILKAKTSFLFLFLFLLCLSCTRPIGYGVISWADDSWSMLSGTVVSIVQESMLLDEVTFEYENEPYTTPAWRLFRFNSLQEATNFAQTLLPFRTTFAISNRKSLPIRDEPSSSADIVYRLDLREDMKVLFAQPEPVDISGLVSTWYEVLTRDGSQGWVFGYHLEVYDMQNLFSEEKSKTRVEDLYDTIWRPDYYESLLAKNTIDLDRFNLSYGILVEPQLSKVTLRVPGFSLVTSYSSITSVDGETFVFEDTAITAEFLDETTLYVYVDQEDKRSRYTFLRISDPDGGSTDVPYITSVIENEQARRNSLLETLAGLSERFVSSTYGSLTVKSSGRFVWTEYEILVPIVIPERSGQEGNIAFSVFLESPELADGIVSFFFDSSSEPIYFAYTLENNGVRLVFLPKGYVEGNAVKELPDTPITAFFSF